jgi:hypothetical protein
MSKPDGLCNELSFLLRSLVLVLKHHPIFFNYYLNGTTALLVPLSQGDLGQRDLGKKLYTDELYIVCYLLFVLMISSYITI